MTTYKNNNEVKSNEGVWYVTQLRKAIYVTSQNIGWLKKEAFQGNKVLVEKDIRVTIDGLAEGLREAEHLKKGSFPEEIEALERIQFHLALTDSRYLKDMDIYYAFSEEEVEAIGKAVDAASQHILDVDNEYIDRKLQGIS